MNRRNFFEWGTGMLAGLVGATSTIPSAKSAPVAESRTPQQFGAMRIEIRNKSLRLQAAWCEIEDWGMSLEAGDEVLRTADAKVKVLGEDPLHIEFHFPKHELTWGVKGEVDQATNTLIFRSTITNGSGEAVTLGRASLFETSELKGFFSRGNAIVYLPIHSGQGLIQVQKLEAKPTTSQLAIEAFNQDQDKALQIGFVTFQRAKTQVTHGYNPGEWLQLKAWCDFDGWEIAPGVTTPTETLIIQVGDNPYKQLERWADYASSLCHPRPREWAGQPIGWVGWSWVDVFDVELYENVVLRNAKAIRERLAGFGVDYIWVSIGNLKDGQPGAWLDWNTKNFPHGHQYLYEQLNQLNFKWGLWCGAFMMSSKLQEKVAEFEDALFKKPSGEEPMVYLRQWVYGLDNPRENFREPIYALDPSNPKTLEYLRKVFRTYRKWGIRYYMIDFLSAGADTLSNIPHAKHYDKKLVSGPEVFRKGLESIREACGDDTHLLASSGPTIQAAGFADGVRTGTDFGEGRPLIPGFNSYPATFMIGSPNYWNGPMRALSNQAATYYTHGRLYINNSGNVLTVDKPLPLGQAQISATIHVMSGGPSMLGDDIDFLDEERLSLIKQTLPRPKEVAFPVDLFAKRKQGYPRVYHCKIVKPWGSYDVVAFYNLEPTESINQKVNLKSIGLDESRKYLAWEFWSCEYIGKVQGLLNVEVPPYSVKVYRLTEDVGCPTVLGTDVHVLMGEVEIDYFKWNPDSKILSGRVIRPVGEKGNLFVYAPPEMGVANPAGHLIAKDGRDNSLIIRCPLVFKEAWVDWSVKFVTL